MCIILQHDKSVHDFSDTDTRGQLYSIHLQWYIHDPLVQHSFKTIFISIEHVVDHCYKTGWKMC